MNLYANNFHYFLFLGPPPPGMGPPPGPPPPGMGPPPGNILKITFIDFRQFLFQFQELL